MNQSLFLDDADLVRLTDRKRKSKQIEWLRQNGIPFRVNATGHPVVTRAAILGRQEPQEAPARGWTPRVIGA
jgi:hypothetical protein